MNLDWQLLVVIPVKKTRASSKNNKRKIYLQNEVSYFLVWKEG